MAYRMTTRAPIFGLRREIERLFDDTFTRDGSDFVPAVDVKENGDEIRLEVELPGIRPEDVEIIAENGVLTVRGQKQAERKEGDDRFQVVERVYGTFMRTFQLPQGVDENQIRADFENGVLTVRIPKTALPQARRIEIGNQGQQRQQASVGSGSASQQSTSNQSTASQSGAGQSSTSQQSTDRTSGQRSTGSTGSGGTGGSTGTAQRDREAERAAHNR
jgi:HSP20 family protein